MKKRFFIFMLILMTAAILAGAVSAQTLSPEDIGASFPKALLREQFVNRTNPQYYRFAKSIWYYDNLGLSYFPSELITGFDWEYINNPGYSWFFNNRRGPEQKDWALLTREATGKVFKQMIYLDEPYDKDVIHGLDFPKVTYQEDFYLYTDLFILDEYPENSGSVYLYFSNSPIIGNRTSYGILIDPRSGIYKAANNYDSFSTINNTSAYSGLYLLGTEEHSLELIEAFDPSLYEGKDGCIGQDIFPAEDLDGKFTADLEAIRQSAEKDGLNANPSVYRMELIRLNGLTAVYINGVFVTEFEDGIISDGMTYYSLKDDSEPLFDGIKVKEVGAALDVGEEIEFESYTLSKIDEDTLVAFVPKNVSRNVSWTIGPRLYAGGETVTMAAGNFYLYGK